MEKVNSNIQLMSQEDYFEACKLTFGSFAKTNPNKMTKNEFNSLLKNL